MTLNDFSSVIQTNSPISFAETMTVISENYVYQPTAFRNGSVENAAGQNEGSCKIFAFAKLHQLTEAQTLSLFGDYYRVDVLLNPNATDHQNIRQFIQHGWAGIVFESDALKAI
ncbi:MAG: HopJ type III effector protein [Methylococcales bacterium]|nr:HopJ type III effector protein [Methylococcales bacterium]MDD5754626.1 HopJ type III effector protein [Methylococcales bacterium]